MRIIDAPQGSLEWITNRLWRLTGSELKANITATGALSQSKAAMKAIDKLIAGIDLANVMHAKRDQIDQMDEWQLKKFMAHYNGESFSGSIHTERGNECEADAIAALSAIIGHQVEDVGMCVMGNDIDGVVACSPDGLVWQGGCIIAGVEVKSPCLFGYYNHVAEGELPDEYKLQVHSGMAICEVDTWHFGSYFAGKPLFHLEVKRDDFTDTLERSLQQFRAVYQDRYDQLQEKLHGMKPSVVEVLV
jgi:hypothetical protein